MIQVEAQWLLVAGILAFHLVDSARLLHFDELRVVHAAGGWRVEGGPPAEFRGRFLWLPNPLAPCATVLAASWLSPAGAADDAASLDEFRRRLRPVRIGCGVAAVLVLAVLPALLLAWRDPRWLLGALAATCVVACATLWATFRQRAWLRLRRRELLSLAAESLLCPPCLPNLYRKLCARRGFGGDPVAFAASTMPGAAQARLRGAIEARIALFALADDAAASDMRAAHARIRGTLA